jgi:hypothetical protein
MHSNRFRPICRNRKQAPLAPTIDEVVGVLRAHLRGRIAADASFQEREATLLAVADEAVRACLERDLAERAASEPMEVWADGHKYRRHQPGTVTYHSLCGPLKVRRWTYRRSDVRNGPTIVPLEHGVGILHGATPALAYSVLLGFGQGPLREYEETMKAAHRHLPSRSTLERLGKTLGTWLKNDVMELEPIVRESEQVPLEAHAIVLGLDRTTVPMEEPVPDAEPPPKHPRPGARTRPIPATVHYRMAYVGTVAVVSADGAAIQARRYAATATDGPSELLERMVLDVRAIRDARPKLPLLVIQDGSPEMWNLVREKLVVSGITGYEQLIDMYHAKEHLARILEILEPSKQRRHERYERYCNLLNEKTTAMQKIADELWDEMLRAPRRREMACWQHHSYLSGYAGAGMMKYAKFRERDFPVGSGVTEGACKSLISVRAKRSGQRWRYQGISAVLTVRALHHSERLAAVWVEFRKQ